MADTGNHPTEPSSAPAVRTRWHSAPWWVGVSGLFTVVGVVVAIVALVYQRPDTPGGSQQPSPQAASASAPGPPNPASAGPSTPSASGATSTGPAAAPTGSAYADPVTEELRMPAPAVGTSTWLDVDPPRVFQVPSYVDDVEAGTHADLEYDSYGEFSTLHTGEFARVGYVPAGDVTVDQCLAKVELQALGQHEKPEVGRNICVVSTQGTVAWIRVTAFTEPRIYGNPTLLVQATIWKPVGA
ncbi:hypothetical protein ACIBF5_28515 [Micromonospora sp. NPDC050417]|uniref:hypothetical protein n=1 Tax=Micromonospora sp. NPDC050417 TaxID=3364280 RepID=UPI0037B5D77C